MRNPHKILAKSVGALATMALLSNATIVAQDGVDRATPHSNGHNITPFRR
jgi:hypothetical protein